MGASLCELRPHKQGSGLKTTTNRRTAEFRMSNFEGRNRFTLAYLLGTGMVMNLIIGANQLNLYAIRFLKRFVFVTK